MKLIGGSCSNGNRLRSRSWQVKARKSIIVYPPFKVSINHGFATIMRLLFVVISLPMLLSCSTPVPLMNSELIGTWSFEGPECSHGNSVKLLENGQAFLREDFSGLWVVASRSVLLILKESGPSVANGSALKTTIAIDSLEEDVFRGKFVESNQKVIGYKCEERPANG